MRTTARRSEEDNGVLANGNETIGRTRRRNMTTSEVPPELAARLNLALEDLNVYKNRVQELVGEQDRLEAERDDAQAKLAARDAIIQTALSAMGSAPFGAGVYGPTTSYVRRIYAILAQPDDAR